MSEPNFKNRTLMHGDNLEFLKLIDSKTIDLIATDPPFNKNKDFHATPDSLAKGASFQDRWSWEKDVHEEWIEEIAEEFPEVMHVINGSRNSYGNDMGAFLCFMAVRILEMRRVLKDTGSMYLHCDPTASHYLKELMDSIFGKKNFRNEIIWKRVNVPKASDYKFGAVHDIILFYVKTNKAKLNPVYIPYSKEYIKQHYKYEDKRGKYQSTPLTAEGIRNGTSGETWRGRDVTRKGLHWIVPTALPKDVSQPYNYRNMTTQEKLDWLDANGLILFPKKQNGMPRFKRYLSTMEGVRMSDLVVDVSSIQGSSIENTGYPTQKPLELYERFIKASTKKDDVILDPFCGCATTCVAAEKLERKWAGIDIWDRANQVVIDRMGKECILTSEDKERNDVISVKGKITYIKIENGKVVKGELKRTDGGREAVPLLPTVMKEIDDTEKDPYSNKEKKELLMKYCGPCCQGCGRELPGRYLQLDHKDPGSSDLIRNRILLCGPCNILKSDKLTLQGLRDKIKKRDWMTSTKNIIEIKKLIKILESI